MGGRLSAAGCRHAFDAHKEAIRRKLKAEGLGKQEANDQAWDTSWKVYQPIVEEIEAKKARAKADAAAARDAAKQAEAPPPVPQQLQGFPEDIRAALDPNYQEKDKGKQLRDGYTWAAMEFVLVIRDTDTGPVADFSQASTPPPNPFALFTVATYALSPIDKRRDLISRALGFATKGYEDTPPPKAEEDGNEGGFLDSVG